tara:strand:+ start:2273 stop:2875 length:603 start_codon:yes stop_codon:yes gene_type:complete
MFTGIIEARGTIAQIKPEGEDLRMLITCASDYLKDVNLGDSVAVSGICLTVQNKAEQGFYADLSTETLGATSSGSWAENRAVNLEKALTPSKALGGHMVSGHVDGLGTLLERRQDARSWRLRFSAPDELAKYIARKGSITIDGISLTVNDVEGSHFGVNIIPHTMDQTTLGDLREGDKVNLEVDLIARYLERLLAARETS